MLASLESPAPHSQLIRLLSAPEGSLEWAIGMRWEIQSCIREPGADRDYVSLCLGNLLRSRGWRLLRSAEDKPFHSFVQFCLSPSPAGLGLTRDEVGAFIA